MASTKDVVDHRLKCFGERDLKGNLFDYAPGAVLFTPDGPLRGADAIRPLFQGVIAELGKPGATFRIKAAVCRGRLCLHSVDGRSRRQRVRGGHGHVHRARRQEKHAFVPGGRPTLKFRSGEAPE